MIVAVDNRPTRSITELQAIIGAMEVGDRVRLRVKRQERYITVELLLRPLGVSHR